MKARAAQRGILGSGLEIEDLGRSGVELAIREAAAREDFRQRQLGNFQNLYNAGQGLRNREIGLEEALVNIQLRRESTLTNNLRSQTGDATSAFLNLFERQSGQATANRLDAEDAAAARRNAIGNLLGTGASFALAGPTGGASLAAPTVQSLFGQQQVAGTQAGSSPSANLSRRRQSDEDDLIRLLRGLPSGPSSSAFSSSLRGGGF